jgi:hypothetical protein
MNYIIIIVIIIGMVVKQCVESGRGTSMGSDVTFAWSIAKLFVDHYDCAILIMIRLSEVKQLFL